MSTKPTLHFICGKLASGKTTLARKIASEESAILICEDEWLLYLYEDEIRTFDDYIKKMLRLRKALGNHVKALLNSGVSVVFDFAGNTPRERAWVRSVFEGANADHLLHVLVANDEECKKRLRQRNEEKPVGLFWGKTPTEAEYDLIATYFTPPQQEEGFKTKSYIVDP